MDNLLNKEPVKRVEKVLGQFDQSIKIQILDKTARTAKDAAESLKTEVGSIVKSLLLRTKTSFLLCLVAGDKRCSLNKVKKLLNQKDVSMANAEQVKKITGFTIGGVSPVAHLNKVDIYIDESLKRFANIFAAAGHPNAVFKIDFKNLKEITNGLIMDISE
tara:strand:+ start:612 stop:1094 length:483 start_codon:yes stop_codon:yes gene_type:complete